MQVSFSLREVIRMAEFITEDTGEYHNIKMPLDVKAVAEQVLYQLKHGITLLTYIYLSTGTRILGN